MTSMKNYPWSRYKFFESLDNISKNASRIMGRSIAVAFVVLAERKLINNFKLTAFMIKRMFNLLIAVCFCTLVTAQITKPTSRKTVQVSGLNAVQPDRLATDRSKYLENVRAAIDGDFLSIRNSPVIKLEEGGAETELERSILIKKVVLLNIDPIMEGMPKEFDSTHFSTEGYPNSFDTVLPYQSYNYPFGIGLSWSIISRKASHPDPASE